MCCASSIFSLLGSVRSACAASEASSAASGFTAWRASSRLRKSSGVFRNDGQLGLLLAHARLLHRGSASTQHLIARYPICTHGSSRASRPRRRSHRNRPVRGAREPAHPLVLRQQRRHQVLPPSRWPPARAPPRPPPAPSPRRWAGPPGRRSSPPGRAAPCTPGPAGAHRCGRDARDASGRARCAASARTRHPARRSARRPASRAPRTAPTASGRSSSHGGWATTVSVAVTVAGMPASAPRANSTGEFCTAARPPSPVSLGFAAPRATAAFTRPGLAAHATVAPATPIANLPTTARRDSISHLQVLRMTFQPISQSSSPMQ